MIKKSLALFVVLAATATSAYGQRRSKRVKQPREVVEAFRVCTAFRSLLAENLDFDRAFEATYVKDPARRRAIAKSDSGIASVDLSQFDDETIIGIYKNRVQLFILVVPFIFAGTEDEGSELFPPTTAAIFERQPPSDPRLVKDYAAQLKRDVIAFRAQVSELATKDPRVAQKMAEYKNALSQPLEVPNRVVKPLTAYSNRHVLPPQAKYYQINDCAVISEAGQMKLIGYRFFAMRW